MKAALYRKVCRLSTVQMVVFTMEFALWAESFSFTHLKVKAPPPSPRMPQLSFTYRWSVSQPLERLLLRVLWHQRPPSLPDLWILLRGVSVEAPTCEWTDSGGQRGAATPSAVETHPRRLWRVEMSCVQLQRESWRTSCCLNMMTEEGGVDPKIFRLKGFILTFYQTNIYIYQTNLFHWLITEIYFILIPITIKKAHQSQKIVKLK